ncbi:MAG: hypothetical protein O2999_07765 [Nitrospirae bacterium]|nr:hypothetical protein [Nitrospirota bacterium]MDA1304182.1 hypothetical protein [Nitrospirota bacterium]
MVIVLLLLAAHIHPWEGIGLEALLFLSIPIDIWALGLCARTVFLERLSIDSPKGMGLRLWAQWALFSAIYLPLLYFVVGGAKALAKSATHATVQFVEESFMVIPVAEKITIELLMWATPTTLVLIAMLYGWMFGLGTLAQRQVRASTAVNGSFQDIVYQWDAIRIPKDQPLLLTAFMGAGVVVVFLFWNLIPVSTHHPHEEYQFIDIKKVEKKIVPKEAIKTAENVLARAEATIKELEKENSGVEKPKNDKAQAGKEESKPSPK